MKKVIVTTFAILAITFSVALAQGKGSSASNSKKQLNVKQFSKDVCNCINKVFKGIHPAAEKLLIDMAEIGEEAALKKFTEYAQNNPDEMAKVEESMNAIGDVGNKMDELCGDIKNKYGKFDESLTKQQKEAIIKHLKNDQKCKIAAAVFQKGFEAK
jgi:hypothetical protein